MKSISSCPILDVISGVVPQLDHRNDGDEIQDCLAQLTGGRSVPRVFVGGKFIGGEYRKKANGLLGQNDADELAAWSLPVLQWSKSMSDAEYSCVLHAQVEMTQRA